MIKSNIITIDVSFISEWYFSMGWPWLRPSVVELLLGWGPVSDIADGGVPYGVVMLSGWVRRECVVFVAKRGMLLLGGLV